MSFMKIVKTKLFLALTLVSLGLLAGCTGDSNVTASTTDVKNLLPTGIIQGQLLDVCTQKPIVDAVIDIGVGHVKTSATGQYVFRNVPATKQADGDLHGDYSVTIDMRNAFSLKDDGTKVTNYPQFAYDEVHVVFAIQSTHTDGGVTTITITGVAGGDQDMSVGQLNGVIRGKVLVNSTLPAAGKFVALYARSAHHNNEAGDPNSTTGASENLVKTATVASDGTYTFSGIEAQRNFRVVATDTDPLSSTAAKPT